MTLKTAVDSAAIRVVGHSTSAVFASQEQIAVEMADLANEVATEIAESYDWRDITKIASFNGDSVKTFFPKPDDYDRMTVDNGIRDQKNWFWGYFPFSDINQYLMMKENGFSLLSPGGWIILNGGFNFVPAPNGTAQFPYISKNIVRANDGSSKPAFTRDDDSFVLSERLLTLGLVWKWRAQKGLEYAEALQAYSDALSQLQTRDKGQRSIRHGMSNNFPTGRIAWPWPLG